jgi:hypothetical protein
MIHPSFEYNNRINSFIHYAVFFVIIFISDDTFNFGTNENYIFFLVKYIIYFILTLFLLVCFNFKYIKTLTKSSLLLALIGISIVLTSFFNLDFSGGYLYQLWLFILGFLIVFSFSNQNIVDVYLYLVYWLSVVSLLIFIIASFSLSLFEFFPIYYNSQGVGFYNLGIGVVFADGFFIRNTSIFREPGVFMIFLSIAMIFELFFKRNIRKRFFFIFLITILSTLSTAAYFILALILTAYLFDIKKIKAKINIKKYILFIGLFTFLVLFYTVDVYNLVFEKISTDNISEGSSLARTVSVVANLYIFLDNFVFGVGLKSHPALFGNYTLDLVGSYMDTGNNTNTITSILSVYGFLFGSIFIYMLFNFAKKTSNIFIVRLLMFLIFLMLFSNEDMRYSLMSVVLLFMGLKGKEVIKEDIN